MWAIPLDGGGPGRSMRDVRAIFPTATGAPNGAVRALFALRAWLGRVFGWDRERREHGEGWYVERLDDADRARSWLEPGSREGGFRVVYAFERETLTEIRNATVHAFLALALTERDGGTLLYWAIYVKPVGRWTRPYMALIDPFRRWIIYPALIRHTQRAWAAAFG